MIAARTRVEIATGNLANVSSDGFAKRVARGRLTSAGAIVTAQQSSEHGALRRTGRALDLAIVGNGSFHVMDQNGRIVETRNGSFERDALNRLVDDRGRLLYGTCGPVILPENGSIGADGNITVNGSLRNHLPLPNGSRLQSGFVETSAVDPITQMVDMLAAQRSYESAQKVVTAIDGVRQKSTTDVARLK